MSRLLEIATTRVAALAGVLVAAWLAAPAALVHAQEPALADPEQNARYQQLIREVRCPKCLNESIADSDAPISADLKREIRKRIEAGASDEEVVEFLVSRYGDFVLYRPRVMPTTWPLWAAPFVFLALGAVVFWRILRVRRNQPLDDDLDGEEEGAA